MARWDTFLKMGEGSGGETPEDMLRLFQMFLQNAQGYSDKMGAARDQRNRDSVEASGRGNPVDRDHEVRMNALAEAMKAGQAVTDISEKEKKKSIYGDLTEADARNMEKTKRVLSELRQKREAVAARLNTLIKQRAAVVERDEFKKQAAKDPVRSILGYSTRLHALTG